MLLYSIYAMIDQINKILKVLAINRQISIGGKKTKATTIQKVFPDWGDKMLHTCNPMHIGQYFHRNVSLCFYPPYNHFCNCNSFPPSFDVYLALTIKRGREIWNIDKKVVYLFNHISIMLKYRGLFS